MTVATFTSLKDAIKELQSRNDVTVCNVSGVDIRDAGVSDLLFALRKNKMLLELNLSNCQLGPQGIIHLSTFLKYNKTLQRLYLQQNPKLGDKGIEELTTILKINKSLTVLNVSNCGIGDIGAAAIADVLKDSNICNLKKLYMYNNKIGCLGASALAEMIINNRTLIELFIWDNPLTDDGLEILEEAYKCTAKNDNNNTTGPRILMITGLKNEKVCKKKDADVKRNYTVPSDKKKKNDGPIVDNTSTGFNELQAKAKQVGSTPDNNNTTTTEPPPRRRLNNVSISCNWDKNNHTKSTNNDYSTASTTNNNNRTVVPTSGKTVQKASSFSTKNYNFAN